MPIIAAPPETPLAYDTSVFTHLRNEHQYIKEKVKIYFSETKQFPAIPAMTLFEARSGIEQQLALKKISPDQAESYKEKITEISKTSRILPFDEKTSEIAAYIFAQLSKSNRNEHLRDLFIIATVAAHNFGLITQNIKDTQLIADNLPEEYKYLRVANWKPK